MSCLACSEMLADCILIQNILFWQRQKFMIGDPMKFLNELKYKLALELGEETSLRQAHNNALQNQNKGLERALKDVQNTSRRTYKGTNETQIQQKLQNYSQKYGSKRNTSRTADSCESSRLKSITKHQENGYSTLRKKQFESNSYKTSQGYAQKSESEKLQKTIKQPPPPSRNDDYLNNAYETEVLRQVGRKQEQELEAQRRMLQQLQANELRLCEDLQSKNRQIEELQDQLQFQQSQIISDLPLSGLNYHSLQTKIEEKDQIIQNYIRIIETLERKRPRALIVNKDVQTDTQELQLDTNCAQAMRMQTSNGLGPNQMVIHYLDEISIIADFEDQVSSHTIINKLNNLLKKFKPQNQILLFSRQSFGEHSSITSKTADFIEPVEMLQENIQDRLQAKKFETQNMELQDKIFQVENDLRNAHLELQELTLKVFELEEDKQKQLQQISQEKQELIDELKRMNEEKQEYQKERQEINQKISQFQEKLKESSQKMLEINKVAPEQGFIIEDSFKENEQSESTIKEEERVIDAQLKEIMRLQRELEQKQISELECSKMKNLNQILENDKQLLQNQLDEQIRLKDDLLKVEIQLKTEIEKINNFSMDLQSQIESLQHNRDQLLEQIEQSNILNERLKNTKEADEEVYQQQLTSLQDQNKQLISDIDQVNQGYTQEKQKNNQLILQNQEDFETIQKLQALIRQNQDHIAKLDEKCAQLDDALNTKTQTTLSNQTKHTQTEMAHQILISDDKPNSLTIAKLKGEIFDLKVKLNETEVEQEKKLLKIQNEFSSQKSAEVDLLIQQKQSEELFKTIDGLTQINDQQSKQIISQENQILFQVENIRNLEAKIDQMKLDLTQKNLENGQLRFQIDRYENLLRIQEEQILKQESVNSTKNQENSDTMLQIENLIQTVKDLKMELEKQNIMKDEQTARILQQKQEYQSLYQSLQQEKIDSQNYQESLTKLQQENLQLREQLQEGIRQSDEQIKNHQNMISDLEARLQELEQTKSVVVYQMSIQGEAFESYKQVKDREIQRLKMQLEDQELRLKLNDTKDLEGQLQTALDENKKLQQSKSAIEKEIQETVQKNQELLKLSLETESQRSDLDAQMSLLTNKYNDQQVWLRSLQKQVVFKEIQLFVNQKRKVENWQLEDLIREINQLQIQDQDSKKIIEELCQEKQGLLLKIKQLQAELSLWDLNHLNMKNSAKNKQL